MSRISDAQVELAVSILADNHIQVGKIGPYATIIDTRRTAAERTLFRELLPIDAEKLNAEFTRCQMRACLEAALLVN